MTLGAFDDASIRELVSASPHALTATRRSTNGPTIVAVSDAWLRLFGYAREEIIGKGYVHLISPEDRERMAARASLPAEREGVTDFRTMMLTKAGEPFVANMIPLRFRAVQGDDYWITIFFVVKEEGDDLALSRALFHLSASLVGVRGEEAVYARTMSELARYGVACRFLTALDAGEDAQNVASALLAGHPVFVGHAQSKPKRVFVPFGPDQVVSFEASSSAMTIDAQHRFVLGLFAKLLQTAIADARAAEAQHRKLAETEALLDLTRTAASTLELGAVLDGACESIAEALDCTNAYIYLYDADHEVLRGRGATAPHRAAFRHLVVSTASTTSIAAAAARDNVILPISDTAETRLARESPIVQQFGERAIIALPVSSQTGLEGVAVLGDTRGPRVFPPEWIELAKAMVAQVGLSMANARLYESLRRSRAEIVKRERLAALGELAAIVAHEVRNPLGVIYNAVSSLRRNVEVETEDALLVEIISEECKRLNHMVGDLIDFARPRELAVEPEDVGRVLQEAVDVASSQPDVPVVRFDVAIEPKLPLLTMDRRLIRQAFVNVAMNAIQATPRGGTVRVHAGMNDSLVTVDFADEGPGIPDDVLPRIFEPFFTTKAQGSGLGLAVVKRIVEEHHGIIAVKSELGRGTTFTFKLPS